MEKSVTLKLRVNEELKHEEEYVLERLGIQMYTAIDMYLKLIVLTGEIPFAVSLCAAPESIDTTKMSFSDIYNNILRGYESYKVGKTQKVAETFKLFWGIISNI